MIRAAFVVLAVVLAGCGSTAEPASRGSLAGELEGAAPWPRNAGSLRARLDALGLPALSREGTALHTHQHLDLYVNGRRVRVPAGIGIDEAQGFIAPLHTHDATGTVHVESPEVRTFTLGDFFGVWGVRFTRRCLGGYCARGAKTLRVYVDGRRAAGDAHRLPLEPNDEIVVAYGTRAQLPRPIPSRYDFPPGL